MKKPLIAANWKMNTMLSEALILANGVKSGIRELSGVDVVLCPPSVWLVPVKEALHQHPAKQLKLGAQNLFWQEKGSYTGEISSTMLRGLVDYVIIGHSERRKYFKESNDELNEKLKLSLVADLTPILCVGELRKPNDALLIDPKELTASSLRSIFIDLDEALSGLEPEQIQNIIIAYEPVWAIGAAAATAVYAEKVTRLITEHIANINGGKKEAITVLYGGSANEKNTVELLQQPHIGGLLVGGASLKVASFVEMCRLAQQVERLR